MLHLLCFAPHPDDGEIHVGGILTKHSMKYNVGLIDLTKGENLLMVLLEDEQVNQIS